jgi:hypothetical protein
MVTNTTPKIVYLDQKCWIDFARFYYGQPSGDGKELVSKILEYSEISLLLFPLSISHLEETLRITSSRRKSQLASLMAKLSKGYSLQPHIDAVVEAEIENIVLRKAGVLRVNIKNLRAL